MEAVKYIFLFFVGIIVLYVCLRLAFTAFFRSWYDQHLKYLMKNTKQPKGKGGKYGSKGQV